MHTVKALSTNVLATSPQYGNILQEYNRQMKEHGKVNAAKFHREVIAPLVPGYSKASWYQFLRRFKTTAGLAAANVAVMQGRGNSEGPSGEIEEANLEQNLMSNEMATQIGIQRALNIGAERLKEIMENPELMTPKEAIDLLFKAMKAQDSRIGAIGKIREDNRQEEAMQRAFKDAAYEQ